MWWAKVIALELAYLVSVCLIAEGKQPRRNITVGQKYYYIVKKAIICSNASRDTFTVTLNPVL